MTSFSRPFQWSHSHTGINIFMKFMRRWAQGWSPQQYKDTTPLFSTKMRLNRSPTWTRQRKSRQRQSTSQYQQPVTVNVDRQIPCRFCRRVADSAQLCLSIYFTVHRGLKIKQIWARIYFFKVTDSNLRKRLWNSDQFYWGTKIFNFPEYKLKSLECNL